MTEIIARSLAAQIVLIIIAIVILYGAVAVITTFVVAKLAPEDVKGGAAAIGCAWGLAAPIATVVFLGSLAYKLMKKVSNA